MTNAIRDHLHIWAVGDTFTGTDDHIYHVAFAGISEVPVAIASHVRSLNGTGHLHSLVDDTYGLPILFKDVTLKMWTTLTQFDALKLLQGRLCYYIPINHMADNEAHASSNVALSPGYKAYMLPLADDQMIDAMMTYWLVTVKFMDDTV